MKFSATELPGLILVEPDVFRDSRGLFYEAYHKEKYKSGGIAVDFVQHNQSRSSKGVLRGLHLQLIQPQAKLVRVLAGEAYDVVVDLRRQSPTFKKSFGLILSADNFKQLFIPSGFAHGFVALTDNVELEYKCSDFYFKAGEMSVAWNDPELAISWPVDKPILSDKDKNASFLKDIIEKLPLT